MQLSISLPEMVHVIKSLKNDPDVFYRLLRKEITMTTGTLLSCLMDQELTDFLGRERYRHHSDQVTNKNYRNGSYDRCFTLKQIGSVTVKVPRDRLGQFSTSLLPRFQRYENSIRKEACLLYLSGISTRTLSMLSSRLLGRSLSPTEISRCSQELVQAVEVWRNRDLSSESIRYLFVDGVCFRMRIHGRVTMVSVLVVIGVNQAGHRKVLSIQAGDKESATAWRECFKDLKTRGLQGESVRLGIMDGLPGLEKVFQEEFPKAKVQRCQVHVARNVLAKVPQKCKRVVADEVRSIFYASTQEKANAFFRAFKEKWEKDIPSAVKCLENSLDSCLTFFSFPEEEWISLRTTNIIERLNKEFRRRTKPMEILAGEKSCYNLLAFIAVKMEMYWKNNPVGKVPLSLPFFQTIMRREVM